MAPPKGSGGHYTASTQRLDACANIGPVSNGGSRLWTPPKGVTLLGPRRHVARERVIVLPNGERVGVKVDDSGTVTHVEHDHTLDAIVRPKTVTIRFGGRGG